MKWLLLGGSVFVLSYLLVPPTIALAWRIGAVDVPCDWRRMHREKLPRAGGVAILASLLGGALFLLPWNASLGAMLLGAGALLLVGLLDDVFCLGAWQKLVAEAAVTLGVLWLSDGALTSRTLPALLWVVALCNAHNMIDGLDGLLAGCAAIEGGALALFFWLSGRGAQGLLPFLLASACLGFRQWNRYPARIFAGDCGSTVVGFLLGILSLPCFEGGGIAGTVAPLLLFAYPLTDLGTAVLRRVLRGKSPFAADRGHLHHRIAAVGLTQVQSAGVLLSLTAGIGLIGVFLADAAFLPSASLAALAAVALLPALRSYILGFA